MEFSTAATSYPFELVAFSSPEMPSKDMKDEMKTRMRFDSSASTMAPESASWSSTMSPAMSPRPSETVFDMDFLLPKGENGVELTSSRPTDAVSSVTSLGSALKFLTTPEDQSAKGINPADTDLSTPPTTVRPRNSTPPRAARKSSNPPLLLQAVHKLCPSEAALPETPRSPVWKAQRTETPPPLVPRSRNGKPPLLMALEMKSLEGVRAVLEKDPNAANERFWDFRCDHPLCMAERQRCGTPIVQLLLNYGADPDAIGSCGRTAAQIAANRDDNLIMNCNQTFGFELGPPLACVW